MRIVKTATVNKWCRKYPDAANVLAEWVKMVRNNDWKNFAELRDTFRSADQVAVRSGRTATVFNIRGNNYRLIAAIHYDRQRLFAMKFLTHREYSADRWKDNL